MKSAHIENQNLMEKEHDLMQNYLKIINNREIKLDSQKKKTEEIVINEIKENTEERKKIRNEIVQTTLQLAENEERRKEKMDKLIEDMSNYLKQSSETEKKLLDFLGKIVKE